MVKVPDARTSPSGGGKGICPETMGDSVEGILLYRDRDGGHTDVSRANERFRSVVNQVVAWVLMITLGGGLGFLTYAWSDRTPPSKVIGIAVTPSTFHIGDPFVVEEVFERRRFCSRTIQQAFVQPDEGIDVSYPAGTFVIPYPFPDTMGLTKQKFTASVPLGMTAGPARYVIRFTWVCDPISWFWPIAVQTDYPVTILHDGERAFKKPKGNENGIQQ